MQERTKAEFRALREMVGVTQQSLADRLGVKILSVKRWELPNRPQQAPDRAWELLYSLLAVQTKQIEEATREPEEVVSLPYWMGSADFEEYADEDEPAQTWTEANATQRAIAIQLGMAGVAVYWHDAAEG